MSLPIHLVGSIPLKDSAEVFSTVAEHIGDHVHKVPDGETGERAMWGLWQQRIFKACPQLDAVEVENNYAEKDVEIRVKPEFTPEQVEFGPLGFAKAAIASYPEFKALKDAGRYKADTRFQVSLPTPLAVVNIFFADDFVEEIEPYYEQAMMAELRAILDEIPASELAIQWDVAVEIMILEMAEDAHVPFDDRLAGICERLGRLAGSVPETVELGFHLCYGDTDHKHFMEPVDMSKLVQVANGVTETSPRVINWIHMPVPRDRLDDAYFVPLKDLKLQPATRLYIGLIHLTDGVEGTLARLDTARRFASDFGIATECGFGRRDPDTIIDLLKVHDAVARSAN